MWEDDPREYAWVELDDTGVNAGFIFRKPQVVGSSPTIGSLTNPDKSSSHQFRLVPTVLLSVQLSVQIDFRRVDDPIRRRE